MTISSALTALNQDIQDARTAIENKGGTVTVDGGSSQLATDIQNIPTFDTITATNTTGSTISADDKVWINKVGADYELINFYQGPYFYFGSKGSSLSFNNTTGEISGFANSSSGCFVIPERMPINTANSWKIVYKAKTPATHVHTSLVNAPNNYYYASIALSLELDNNNNYMACAIRTESGNVWNIWLLNIQYPTEVDTWYWWSVEFTGTEYILKQSTDGVNFIELARVTSSTKAHQPSQNIATGYVGRYWRGSVDLSESYIEVNGSLWWKGALKDTQAANCLTGYTQDDIANNATGNVKTLLPEMIDVTITADADDADITAV